MARLELDIGERDRIFRESYESRRVTCNHKYVEKFSLKVEETENNKRFCKY